MIRARAAVLRSLGGSGIAQEKRGSIAHDSETPPRVYQIRQRRYTNPELDPPTFYHILRHNSSTALRELELGGQFTNFDPETWTILVSRTTHLRALKVVQAGDNVHGPLPAASEFLGFFPRLQRLEYYYLKLKTGPDFSTMTPRLQGLDEKYQQQYRKDHPLKTLRVTGTYKDPLKILVDIMASEPLSHLEAFIISKSWTYQRHGFWHLLPILRPDWEFLTSSLTRWPCLESLTHLNIHLVLFPARSTTAQFFARLQECVQLAALMISIRHLRDLVEDAPMMAKVPSSPVSVKSYSRRNSSWREEGQRDKQREKQEALTAQVEKEYCEEHQDGNDEAMKPRLDYYFPTVKALELVDVKERTRPMLEPKLELYELQLLLGEGGGGGGGGGAMPDLELLVGQDLSCIGGYGWVRQMYPRLNRNGYGDANKWTLKFKDADTFTWTNWPV